MTVGTKTMLAVTPGFQSPEQLKAESVGMPSNVYAFGGFLAVLFVEQPPNHVQSDHGKRNPICEAHHTH